MSFAGRTLYHLWHRPIGAMTNSVRHGGPLAQRTTARAQAEMMAAAESLPSQPARTGAPSSVHFLTGRRFAYQTAFCLHTLAHYSTTPITPEFYDDGSLDTASRALLLRLTPNARIHDASILRDRLDQFLPSTRFPVLRERWLNYPHLRKLIDVHLGRAGWRLVMDSDLLFWQDPRFLIDWLATPDRPLHATDCEENYGYPRAKLEQLAGCPIPTLVNVGLCGLRSDSIDWEYLEHASASLIDQHGTSYYLEQALVALLVARSPVPCAVAPASDYITYPKPAEIAAPTAVMHHYVDLSRDAYHRQAWRSAFALGS
jgi:hypothetical protein